MIGFIWRYSGILAFFAVPLFLRATNLITDEQLPIGLTIALFAVIAWKFVGYFIKFAVFGIIGAAGYALLSGVPASQMVAETGDFMHTVYNRTMAKAGSAVLDEVTDQASTIASDVASRTKKKYEQKLGLADPADASGTDGTSSSAAIEESKGSLALRSKKALSDFLGE